MTGRWGKSFLWFGRGKNAKDLTEKKIVKFPHLSGWNEGVQRVGGADRAWKDLEREWRHKSISS